MLLAQHTICIASSRRLLNSQTTYVLHFHLKARSGAIAKSSRYSSQVFNIVALERSFRRLVLLSSVSAECWTSLSAFKHLALPASVSRSACSSRCGGRSCSGRCSGSIHIQFPALSVATSPLWGQSGGCCPRLARRAVTCRSFDFNVLSL